MWQRLLLACALLLLVPTTPSWSFVIHEGVSWPQALTGKTKLWLDEAGDATVDWVASSDPSAVGFQPLAHAGDNGRGASGKRWLLLDLSNEQTRPLALVLTPGTRNASRIDYFLLRANAREHHITGDAVRLPHANGHDRLQGLAFTLAPQERVRILARVESTRPVQLSPRLYTQDTFEKSERQTALWDGLLFGGLALLGWGALMIAVLTPSLSFVPMSALCFGIALYEATVRGYGKLYLWPESTVWAANSATTVGQGSVALLLIFILGITRQERIPLPCRKTLTALVVATLLVIGMQWVGLQSWAAQLIVPLTMARSFTLLLVAVLLLKRRTPTARIILLTGMFIAGHAMLRLATWSNLLPNMLVDAGLAEPTTDPVVALTGLALNVGVLAAWIIEIGKQRRQARDELVSMKQQESQRLKEQVALQTDALNRSLQYAQEENRRKTEMLGYIGHDLRAPLATIVGHARRLAGRGGKEEQDHVQAIERSADYQLSLINEILEYAKYELKPLEVQPSPTPLARLLTDVGRHARSLGSQQGNQYTFQALTPLPSLISVDAKRLQQTLLNLISNAAKFTRSGTIGLTVSATDDRGRNGDGQILVFTISDTGCGITPGQQSRMFLAFEQGDAPSGGVGLGLHIAQRIIAQMGGELTLQSKPGQGSEFSFTLPVRRLSDSTFQTLADEPPAPEHESADSPIALPPVELRVDLAKYARDGQLSEIEEWLAKQARRHPAYARYFEEVEAALQELAFERIEAMAVHGLR